MKIFYIVYWQFTEKCVLKKRSLVNVQEIKLKRFLKDKS